MKNILFKVLRLIIFMENVDHNEEKRNKKNDNKPGNCKDHLRIQIKYKHFFKEES